MMTTGIIGILRRRWRLAVASLLLCLLGSVVVNAVIPKKYTATVQIFVATPGGGSIADLSAGNSFTQARVQSYTSIIQSPEVATAVIKQLGLGESSAQLSAQLSADAPPDKVLINVHAESKSAQLAAAIANSAAEQFSKVVEDFEQKDGQGNSVVRLSVITPAQAPSTPDQPRPVTNLLIGLVAGLALGCAVAVLRDRLDNTVKASEDTSEIGLPVLVSIPFDKRSARTPSAFKDASSRQRVEAYRQLRSNMHFINVDSRSRLIAVTSGSAGEGKSTTALNLALALAEVGNRVCLVDADLRRPSVAGALGLVPSVGLTSVLIGQASVEDSLQNGGMNLAVMTSGPIPPNPSELLNSETMRELIGLLLGNTDYVILDTAPVLPVADGGEVAALADATIVVMRSGKTTMKDLKSTISVLTRVGARPVGGVINMAPARSLRYGSDYYYESAASPSNGSVPSPLDV